MLGLKALDENRDLFKNEKQVEMSRSRSIEPLETAALGTALEGANIPAQFDKGEKLV